LLAPDSLQLRIFSNNMISDIHKAKTSYNQEKLLAYLNNKFPDSEYVAIIKELMAQSQSTDANDEVIIVENSPSSIKEMMQLPGIKGKYAYIDLWATWCAPCLQEFQYGDEIHKLLAQYNNIALVYISTDDDKERERWKSSVTHYNLMGYNIMASKSLNEDIGKKVYNADKVGFIPRYLLLDPDGIIVNDNLPRPSSSVQLKSIFDKVLK